MFQKPYNSTTRIPICVSHKLLLFASAIVIRISRKKNIVSQTFLLTLKLKFNLYDTDIWQFNVSFALDYCLKSPSQRMTVPLCGSRPLFFRVFRVGQKSSCCRQTSICIVTMIRNVTHFSTRKENSIPNKTKLTLGLLVFPLTFFSYILYFNDYEYNLICL